jgi:hypothetical protein
MHERLVTFTLFLVAVLLGYVIRGGVEHRKLAGWINASCEVKERLVAVDVEARRKGETPFYLHCE